MIEVILPQEKERIYHLEDKELELDMVSNFDLVYIEKAQPSS